MFPTDLVDLPNPDPRAPTNSPVTPLSGGIANLNAVVEALQAKVGVNGSSIAGSIDKRLTDVESVADGAIAATPAALGAVFSAASQIVLPDNLDRIAILDSGTGAVKTVPWWRTQKRTGERSPIQIFPGNASSPLAQVTGVTGSPTLSYEIGPNGKYGLKVVTGAGTTTEVSFSQLVGQTFDGDLYLAYFGGYDQGVASFNLYITPDASYSTNYALIGLGSSFTTGPVNVWREQGGATLARFSRPSGSITGSITYPFTIGAAKIRIAPVSGQVATVWIYGVGLMQKPAKGRCFVVADDGFASWITTGVIECAIRGIPTTSAIIPQLVGQSSYASLDQLKSYLNAGNAIIAHGPNIGSAASNLIDLYPGDPASQIADMNSSRDYLFANGLGTRGAEMCYIWPQGQFQAASGDLTTLDAALAAGYTTGRSASGITKTIYTQADSMPKYPHLAMPFTAHGWAGTTASQVANITNVTDSINNAATAGSDVFVVFHDIVPTSTVDGSMTSTKCRVSDLRTILDAIKNKIDAGTLEARLFTDLALTHDNFWGGL